MKLKKLALFFGLTTLLFCCKEKPQKQPESEVKKETIGVTILKDSFAVKNVKDSLVYRNVWLYLPPNYNETTESFPVIYMHDGQNLFDAKTSYAGEWNVDETLNELYKETGKGFIVVGVNNTGVERLNEYSPWTHKEYGGGSGDRYLEMIISKLKPKIDAEYRTKTDAASTTIMGSSMGGLISYYAGLKHPDVFGNIGALSTSFWFSDDVYSFTKENANLQDSRLYLLVGGKEGGGMVESMRKVEKLLPESGFASENLTSKEIPEGQHNEALWRGELKEVVKWLYKIE